MGTPAPPWHEPMALRPRSNVARRLSQAKKDDEVLKCWRKDEEGWQSWQRYGTQKVVPTRDVGDSTLMTSRGSGIMATLSTSESEILQMGFSMFIKNAVLLPRIVSWVFLVSSLYI